METTFTQLLTRRLVILAIVVGFCLLPGPRSFIVESTAYLLLPESIASFKAGLHLSVVHFCWLFGLEMPTWELPENVDPWLATIALMASGIAQVAIVRLIIYIWNGFMFQYYVRKVELEEREEFGEFEGQQDYDT